MASGFWTAPPLSSILSLMPHTAFGEFSPPPGSHDAGKLICFDRSSAVGSTGNFSPAGKGDLLTACSRCQGA